MEFFRNFRHDPAHIKNDLTLGKGPSGMERGGEGVQKRMKRKNSGWTSFVEHRIKV
jgi:hypothetical protein